ncbi:hypothetical protein HQ865_02275 [Mucilaginibacter mali]|uniref:Glycosyltransferase RgtA/B/C/D-like domain-containing protein n=1 Tax=Mucilaginibacter mali TaxID=2740462 RepID=A0A7D4QHS0_9SPHI|nr:hypothetical protein [Mucilaginibacter mali]QKJ28630.1 hypothetical protein HQ865_02275 [Mucilaginibacter mali]
MNLKSLSQFFAKDKSHRILILLACLLALVLGILSWSVPPGIDPDPCWGFLVMDGIAKHAPWNTYITVDPFNIAKNHYEFLAWWSPGQYLVPYLFKCLLNINTAKAVAVTLIVCNVLGLTGFYKLFTRLGFSRQVSAITIAFVATQLFFVNSYVYFLGGEVLLFAFLGWFLYGCFSIEKITWQILLFVFLGGLLGFFAKSSVLWMFAAAVGCIWINVGMAETGSSHKPWYDKTTLWAWIRNGLLLAIPFVAALAVIYVGYMSKGDNPTSDTGPLLVLPETFGYPLAAPILSGFSVDELVDGLIYHTDAPMVSYQAAIMMIVIFALACIAFVAFIGKLSHNKKYPVVLIFFYALGTAFFSYMYIRQATISYEGRHFRMIAMLFMPGFVYLLMKTKVSRMVFFAMWIAYAYLSFNSFKIQYVANRQTAKGPVTGFVQQVYDQATIDEVVRLDHMHYNDAIFVFNGPDIAMEVKQNRTIINDDDMNETVFASLKYRGKAGTIYIITPTRYIKNGKLSVLTKSFVDYHHFTYRQITAAYGISEARE